MWCVVRFLLIIKCRITLYRLKTSELSFFFFFVPLFICILFLTWFLPKHGATILVSSLLTNKGGEQVQNVRCTLIFSSENHPEILPGDGAAASQCRSSSTACALSRAHASAQGGIMCSISPRLQFSGTLLHAV